MPQFVPSLHVLETRGRVRITVPGITHGSGQTLQDAADDLVRNVLVIATGFRAGAVAQAGSELPFEPAIHEFMWELAGIAAGGGDIRGRLLGARLTT